MTIAFVTDSTAYIPPDLVKQYAITVAPQTLIWGDQTFLDGIDIQPDEFYARLKTAKTMPSTAQVSVVIMQEIFQRLVEQGHDVIGTFISAKLSGTMQSCLQAREALGAAGDKVTLVDSDTTSMAMGYMLLTAARAAEQGASLEDCKQLIEKGRGHVGVYFAVDTLEFLHRGGRIGGATRFIGSALNLKPILQLKDGQVEAIDRVRTKSKAVEHLLALDHRRIGFISGPQELKSARIRRSAFLRLLRTHGIDRDKRLVEEGDHTVDGGLAAMLYAPCEVSALAADNVRVRIVEETAFPFEETVRFVIHPQKPAAFPLRFRVPGWATGFTVRVNAQEQTVPAREQVLTLSREWKDGDAVSLEFKTEVRLSRWVENSVAIERGPLVYALQIDEDWKQVKSADAFGEYYEVRPKSPWNYALLEKAVKQPQSNFTVVRQSESTAYPWSQKGAPIQLRAQGKRVPEWQLYNEMSGPLPHSRPLIHLKDHPAEDIVLLPYGCTRLRITEFPVAQ